MQSKGKSVFTAAIFSLLFVIMLPLRPVSDVPNGLTITATGERNSQAKSDEVWLSTSMERAIRESATRIDDGWELRNGSLVSFRNQPATIQAKVPINEGDTLIFTMHEYSGIVEIGSGKYSRRYDLYSDTPNTLRIDLYATLPRELNLGRTLLKGVLVYGAAFVFFFAISLFLARGLGSEEKKSALVSGERAKLSLWFAIPSIVIYGGVLAAYWPAQMSPDSIEQWRQIVTGEYADAHPLMSTLLYKLAFLVYPAPQAAALLQIFAYSTVTWFFLREMMAWGVPRYIVFITAVLFPAFPGNFMLVSTLWKDIPFTIGVILLSTLAAREVRQKLTLTWGSVIAMSLAGILTFGVRHNGILIVIPFFMLLFLFSKGRDKKLKVVIALASQVIVFLLMKTLLLTVFNAAPVGSHYRSIFALHVLAAMENADVPFDASDAALMYKVMPQDEWKKAYDCHTSVPLFWNKYVSYETLAENARDLNVLMFKQIARHPVVFLRHQVCVTSLIWRIGGRKDEFVALSPAGITEMPIGRELGLKMHSLLPEAKRKLDKWHSQIFAKSNIYTRPAIYSLLGLLAVLMVMRRSVQAAFLIYVPALFNSLSLAPLIGSQDYRYLWPSVAMSLLVIVMAIGMAISGARMGGARQPQP